MNGPEVKLLSYTPDALMLLLRTKGTRLAHAEDPALWPEEKRAEHLQYMFGTVKSSWEFVDYTFAIHGVTRAFTHQLVRTRTGSYAQEAQRVVDVRDRAPIKPATFAQWPRHAQRAWELATKTAMGAYAKLLDSDVSAQDARGLLPTNTPTSIIAKFNLRTLSDMALLRLCTRTQGEYQEVFRALRTCVLAVHPWAAPFLDVHCVATGTCAFPNYGPSGCPVWFPELDAAAVKQRARERFWSVRHESVPRAGGDGMTV